MARIKEILKFLIKKYKAVENTVIDFNYSNYFNLYVLFMSVSVF